MYFSESSLTDSALRSPFAFAALDFETTGAVAGYPVEPWQIGVVRVDAQGARCWEHWLRVGPRPFHPRAPGRHEQVRGELERAPFLQDLVPELRGLCGGVPMVAHNVATEQKCLRDAVPMERFGPWIDTLKLSRALWPGLRSHKLGDLLAGFGLRDQVTACLPERGEHDALFDAMGSAVLLIHILELPVCANISLDVLVNPDQMAYYQLKV
jgi:DNA polymerase-3 subunit epsilon